MNLIEILNWRYSVKKYRNKKVSQENVNEILEAIRLSASSAGMQPYKVLVIESEEVKKKLQEASFNPQVSECSHLLVFAAYKKVKEAHINEYMNLVAQVRDITPDSLEPFRTKLEGYLLPLSGEQTVTWAGKQAYIGLGTGIVAAANLGVDTCPMEGFDAAKFDEILELEKQGLQSVVLLALGYRDEENDFFAKVKKVRVPMEKFVVTA
jgi:nitroreductase